jgi:hypothetical protein
MRNPSHRRVRTFAICFCLALLLVRVVGAQENKSEEIKRIYKQLIDAQNKHDLPAVRALVWDSPSTLCVAKAPVGWHGYWGIDDVMQHLHDMYQLPFRIDPIYEDEKVVFITPVIAETTPRSGSQLVTVDRRSHLSHS